MIIKRKGNFCVMATKEKGDKDLRPNTEGCDGYCRSWCCGANIDLDMGLCFECHDHSDTACSHCENQCEDMRTV